MRLITSLNWVLGVLALIAALVVPPVIDALSGSFYAVAEETAKSIVRAQSLYLSVNNSFRTFDAVDADNRAAFNDLNLSPPATEDGVAMFLYSAQTDDEGALVVTARTNPALVQKEGYRPMVYTHRVTSAGDADGRWMPLSGKKRGLGLF